MIFEFLNNEILKKIFEYASTDTLIILFLILVNLDQTLIECKLTQICVCYVHFLFYFFMNINGFLYYFLLKVVSPLTLISRTLCLFLIGIYFCYRQAFDYLNLLIKNPVSINPFLSICELYLVTVIFIFLLSIPSFVLFYIVKNPMAKIKNYWMLRKEFNYMVKVILVMCVPFNRLVLVSLSISAVDSVHKMFKKRLEK